MPSVVVFAKDEDGLSTRNLHEWSLGRKIVFFFVPGAFTQTCSEQHLPGFIEHSEAFMNKGADAIACLSVNDPHVMLAWGNQSGAAGKIVMLADPQAELATALGTNKDFGPPLGVRSKRCGFITNNGIVTYVHIEDPGELSGSSAIEMLAALEAQKINWQTSP